MTTSIYDPEARALLDGAQRQSSRVITLDQASVEVPAPFASPEDWRDQWIYFLMLDRFNNPTAPPRNLPYDAPYGDAQDQGAYPNQYPSQYPNQAQAPYPNPQGQYPQGQAGPPPGPQGQTPQGSQPTGQLQPGAQGMIQLD